MITICPCGTGKSYDSCCGIYLSGKAEPSTAEALMRSRYSAFSRNDIEYLAKTMGTELRKDFDAKGTSEFNEKVNWIGLEILNSSGGSEEDETGIVEFQAQFEVQGELQVVHERSLFGREQGRWVYTEGLDPRPETVKRTSPKIGRNQKCPCGSGKKYKKCCG